MLLSIISFNLPFRRARHLFPKNFQKFPTSFSSKKQNKIGAEFGLKTKHSTPKLGSLGSRHKEPWREGERNGGYFEQGRSQGVLTFSVSHIILCRDGATLTVKGANRIWSIETWYHFYRQKRGRKVVPLFRNVVRRKTGTTFYGQVKLFLCLSWCSISLTISERKICFSSSRNADAYMIFHTVALRRSILCFRQAKK